MAESQPLNGLIRLVYECATDPAQWPVFLTEFAKAVGAHASGFVVQDLQNHAGQVTAGAGFDPFWEKKYGEYYAGINVWTKRGSGLFQPGRVVSGDEALTDAELVRTEFYVDFLQPQQHFYSFGGTIMREGPVTSFFTALRSRKAGPFSETERALTRELMPHFESAVRIHQRVTGLESRLAATSGALNSFSRGVIVTDGAGTVLYLNRRMEELLAALSGGTGSSLILRGNKLSSKWPREAVRLRELIERAAETITGKGSNPGGAMSIPTTDGTGALRIFVAPLASTSSAWAPIEVTSKAGSPAVILFVSSGQNTSPGTAALKELLQLTEAEARLADALLEGKTVRQFAEETAVSLNTARTHLKRVFQKAGVKRQSELMRLAAMFPDSRAHSR